MEFDAKEFETEMHHLGFKVEETGGGCQAYIRPVNGDAWTDSPAIIITAYDDPSLPDGWPVTVGVTRTDGIEEETTNGIVAKAASPESLLWVIDAFTLKLKASA